MAIGPHIVDNQCTSVTAQLDLGIRLLQAQVHPWSPSSDSNPSGISLCHISCYSQNVGYLESWLKEVFDGMDQHPSEIVTLLLTNPEMASVDDWAAGFESLAAYDRAHFQERLADVWRHEEYEQHIGDLSKFRYIMNEFGNVWENPYNQTSLPFKCSVDRRKNPMDRLGLINHILNDEVVGTGIKYADKDLLEKLMARWVKWV
uniref:Plc-like phosphodiesterase n=1 Tax=Melanopsichium pennsylvanicum 4 TaxID=1398559 RepID=A0A077R753_9BASI|nr:plc-like phosphodiesterase [Melanopsichium pennsylvanicum 4]